MMKYKNRLCIRVVAEAMTPLSIGSGDKGINTDAMLMTDVNGLPYLPGSTIAGVLRHTFVKGKLTAELFGFQDGEKGLGSRVIVTEGRMIGKEGKVVDGIESVDWDDPEFYRFFKTLPIRQHVKISEKGIAKDGGKFDQEVVYKGTKFCFEIEIWLFDDNTQCNENIKTDILNTLRSVNFRLGSGTRNGFGEIKIEELKSRIIDLSKPTDLSAYADKSSSFNEDEFWKIAEDNQTVAIDDNLKSEYVLKIKPSDTFLFGSGFDDEDAKFTPVNEAFIKWDNGIPEFSEKAVLIPATSVKGALRHRVAFHYNRLAGQFEDSINLIADTDKNKAVKAIFGYEVNEDGNKKCERGEAIFSDVIEHIESCYDDMILNHVAIDRFTGGAISGMLYNEKVNYIKDKTHIFELKILIKNDIGSDIIKALEYAIEDICKGRLPLGGGVNRGHGIFKGEYSIKEFKTDK